MFTFTHNHYLKLAETLLEQIGTASYYSNVIELEQDDADIKFCASLIIYHHGNSLDELPEQFISDVVPVWWELKTTTLDGEQINDFDFDVFKQILCQC